VSVTPNARIKRRAKKHSPSAEDTAKPRYVISAASAKPSITVRCDRQEAGRASAAMVVLPDQAMRRLREAVALAGVDPA
jgi:hypothetical protein